MVPAGIRQVIEQLLAKEPDQRLPDALSVSAALESSLAAPPQPDDQSTVVTVPRKDEPPASKPPLPGGQNDAESIAKPVHTEEGRPQTLPEQQPQLNTVSPSSKTRYFPPWAYGLVAVGGVAMIGLVFLLQDPARKEMVHIPAGKFWMGCKSDVDQSCEDDEKPGREVDLDAFRIDTYEVSVADYRQCVEAGACSEQNLTKYESCHWNKSDRADHPINCVDWNQARSYCQWAEKRLPSEAEWEKAARGDDGRTYPWGNEWGSGKANTSEGNLGRTMSVGLFQVFGSACG